MLHVDTESNSMKWIQSHQECISCNWNMYIPQLVDDLLQHTGGSSGMESWNGHTLPYDFSYVTIWMIFFTIP